MSKLQEQVTHVRALAQAVIEVEGYELLDVELVVEAGRRILRLFIDTVPPSTKGRGVGVDDCEKISRTVSDLLDVEDPIEGAYVLEVSSPGVFRPLTKPEHFDRAVGQRVKIKTFRPTSEGRKAFTGLLVGRAGVEVEVDVDGATHRIEMVNIAKANLEPLL